MTDRAPRTRVTFELMLEHVPESLYDDRIPSYLTRAAEKTYAGRIMEALGDAVDTVRFDPADQPEPATEEPAVAEQLDLEALGKRIVVQMDMIGLSHNAERVAALVLGLLTDGATPTKPAERMRGQGLNREQLTDVIAKNLEITEELSESWARQTAAGLVAAIEAAQLHGSLS